MSQRNGDKARFRRERQRKLLRRRIRKVLLRKNIREFTKAPPGEGPLAENTAVRK